MKLADAIQYAIDRAKATGKPQVIARRSKGAHGYQVRFTHTTAARDTSRRVRTKRDDDVATTLVEGRKWLDQSGSIPQASTRGTVGPYVGWSRWSKFLGWNVASVLADDWQPLEPSEVEAGP